MIEKTFKPHKTKNIPILFNGSIKHSEQLVDGFFHNTIPRSVLIVFLKSYLAFKVKERAFGWGNNKEQSWLCIQPLWVNALLHKDMSDYFRWITHVVCFVTRSLCWDGVRSNGNCVISRWLLIIETGWGRLGYRNVLRGDCSISWTVYYCFPSSLYSCRSAE